MDEYQAAARDLTVQGKLAADCIEHALARASLSEAFLGRQISVRSKVWLISTRRVKRSKLILSYGWNSIRLSDRLNNFLDNVVESASYHSGDFPRCIEIKVGSPREIFDEKTRPSIDTILEHRPERRKTLTSTRLGSQNILNALLADFRISLILMGRSSRKRPSVPREA